MSLTKGAIKRNIWNMRAEIYRNSNGMITPRHPDKEPKVYNLESKPVQRSKRPWEK